jgi:5-(aminomethyl)-3-furanmethanol phosphate kinase
MSGPRVSVVKIGGSLLTRPDLSQRLRAWLMNEQTSHPPTHFVLIAGGGQWVETIRAIDAKQPLGVERAHWICVSLMDVTAGLVGAMLPELFVVDATADLQSRLPEPGATLLRPSEFVSQVEPMLPGIRLPADWSVTSDAIAGRLAVALGADELALLKSTPPPIAADGSNWLARLAAAGYVDGFLPSLAAELPALRCVKMPAADES